MDISNFGTSIKNNRERLSLTQEKLAELMNVSTHYIYELEKCGKTPSFPMAIKLAELFHTSIDSMLTETNSESAQTDNDKLEALLNKMPDDERKKIYDILCGLLPYLKL